MNQKRLSLPWGYNGGADGPKGVRRWLQPNTFCKPGCMPITNPKHEPIKKVYVQMVKEVVGSGASDHGND